MGKIGRFACILTPMLLTLASLICIVIVMLGQHAGKGNKAPATSLGRDLYFFKADTSGFTPDPKSALGNLPKNTNIDNDLLQALQNPATATNLEGMFFQIGLWSYCEGTKDGKTGHEEITFCSSGKSNFWFDPTEVWQLKGTNLQKVLGDKFEKGMNEYKKASGWMIWSFTIALILSAVEFIVGFFAIISRWGSLVTTIVSTAQTIFIFVGAIIATVLFSLLAGVFDSVLKPYNIKASVGKQMLSVVWLAVAFSLASGLFWLFSVCCCSGKSPHKKVSVEKTPYTYERVGSPAFPMEPQQQQHHAGYANAGQQQQVGTAYEPFRQQHV